MSNRERIILSILAGLNFTHILDFMIMMPLGNYLMPYFNIGTQQFSILVSAYSVSAFISGIFAALIIDKFDRKKVLILSYIGFVLGTIACGLADSYQLLLTARIVAGLFGGIIGAQVLAIVADLFAYERRGMAMGAVMSAFAVASVLGVYISLKITNAFNDNWHLPFLMIGGIGALLIPLLFAFIPSMTSHIRKGDQRRSSLEVLMQILKLPAARNALLFSCILMMGHFLVVPFINPYLEFNIGFPKTETPKLYVAGGVASLLAAFAIGRLADKKGKLPVFSVSVFLSLFMAILITRLPVLPIYWIMIFFAIWFVFATGRAVTAQAMISEAVPSEWRGSFMSFNGSVQQLGSGIASVLAGLIVYKDPKGQIQHFEWLGYISVVILLISLIMGRQLFAGIDNASEEEELSLVEGKNG